MGEKTIRCFDCGRKVLIFSVHSPPVAEACEYQFYCKDCAPMTEEEEKEWMDQMRKNSIVHVGEWVGEMTRIEKSEHHERKHQDKYSS